jgi:hypothetical protein
VSITRLIHDLCDAIVEAPLIDAKWTIAHDVEADVETGDVVLIGSDALRLIRKHVSVRQVVAFSQTSASCLGDLKHGSLV